MHDEHAELTRSLKEKFELEIPEGISEQKLLQLIELRLSQLLERTTEEFFQIMYRIDIPEYDLNRVLQRNDAIQVLAKMIYDRQLEKAKSRLKYKSYFEDDKADNELKW